MTTKYGPAERLNEQIDILLRDPRSTEIVMLSMLGEPALPRLCAILDADTKGKREWRHAIALIRVLGMSGHPSVVPSLALRLSTFTQERYGRDETEPRAITHALRKVGTDEALRVILDNLDRVDLAHVKTILDHFGERARDALVARSAQFDHPTWVHAAKLATAMHDKRATPLLVHAAEKTLVAHNLLAYFGKDAPKEWAVKRLLDIQAAMTKEYLKRAGRRHEYGYRDLDEEAGPHPEHDALLRILYNAGDPSVLRTLAPYLEYEHAAGITLSRKEPPASVTLLALAFGETALPHLKDEDYAREAPEVRQAIKDIRGKIAENVQRRAKVEEARKGGWYNGEDGTIRAPAFKLEKSPLGEDDVKGETDPLPAPRETNQYYDDDD